MPGAGYGTGLHADIEVILKQGIGAIVSLTEVPVDSGMLRENGLKFLHLPIADMQAPTLEQCGRFTEFASANMLQETPVLVHCTAGLGRTGTMLACYLVHQGTDPSHALSEVRVKRPGSVETETQEAIVFEYAATIKEKIRHSA